MSAPRWRGRHACAASHPPEPSRAAGRAGAPSRRSSRDRRPRAARALLAASLLVLSVLGLGIAGETNAHDLGGRNTVIHNWYFYDKNGTAKCVDRPSFGNDAKENSGHGPFPVGTFPYDRSMHPDGTGGHHFVRLYDFSRGYNRLLYLFRMDSFGKVIQRNGHPIYYNGRTHGVTSDPVRVKAVETCVGPVNDQGAALKPWFDGSASVQADVPPTPSCPAGGKIANWRHRKNDVFIEIERKNGSNWETVANGATIEEGSTVRVRAHVNVRPSKPLNVYWDVAQTDGSNLTIQVPSRTNIHQINRKNGNVEVPKYGNEPSQCVFSYVGEEVTIDDQSWNNSRANVRFNTEITGAPTYNVVNRSQSFKVRNEDPYLFGLEKIEVSSQTSNTFESPHPVEGNDDPDRTSGRGPKIVAYADAGDRDRIYSQDDLLSGQWIEYDLELDGCIAAPGTTQNCRLIIYGPGAGISLTNPDSNGVQKLKFTGPISDSNANIRLLALEDDNAVTESVLIVIARSRTSSGVDGGAEGRVYGVSNVDNKVGPINLVDNDITLPDPDPDEHVTIEFNRAVFEVNENNSPAGPVLVLSDEFDRQITLTVNVTGGTATASTSQENACSGGGDFNKGPYTVVLDQEVARVTFDIFTCTDDLNENTETIELTLDQTALPTGVTCGNAVDRNNDGSVDSSDGAPLCTSTIEIIDWDAPVISFKSFRSDIGEDCLAGPCDLSGGVVNATVDISKRFQFVETHQVISQGVGFAECSATIDGATVTIPSGSITPTSILHGTRVYEKGTYNLDIDASKLVSILPRDSGGNTLTHKNHRVTCRIRNPTPGTNVIDSDGNFDPSFGFVLPWRSGPSISFNTYHQNRELYLTAPESVGENDAFTITVNGTEDFDPEGIVIKIEDADTGGIRRIGATPRKSTPAGPSSDLRTLNTRFPSLASANPSGSSGDQPDSEIKVSIELPTDTMLDAHDYTVRDQDLTILVKDEQPTTMSVTAGNSKAFSENQTEALIASFSRPLVAGEKIEVPISYSSGSDLEAGDVCWKSTQSNVLVKNGCSLNPSFVLSGQADSDRVNLRTTTQFPCEGTDGRVKPRTAHQYSNQSACLIMEAVLDDAPDDYVNGEHQTEFFDIEWGDATNAPETNVSGGVTPGTGSFFWSILPPAATAQPARLEITLVPSVTTVPESPDGGAKTDHRGRTYKDYLVEVNRSNDYQGVVWFTMCFGGTAQYYVDYRLYDETAPQGEGGGLGLDHRTGCGFELGIVGRSTDSRDKKFYLRVYDDAHDEGDETIHMQIVPRRSPPASLVGRLDIDDTWHTITITNNDPMPATWLARFGRTVAGQALDAIAGRIAAPRNAGVEGTVAGQAIAPGDGIAGSADEAGLARGLGGTEDEPGRFGADDTPAQSMSARDALLGSSFTLTGAEDGAGGSMAFWGRAAQARFDGSEGDASFDGEVTTAMLGADYARGDWLLGLALSRSRGEGGYRGKGETGTVESSLMAAIPYAALDVSGRLKLWGAAGHGSGRVTLGTGAGERLDADIGWTMAAAGLRGDLLGAPAEGEGPALALVSDALWARTTSEKTRGLMASESDVTRLRLGMEGSYRLALADGGHVAPKLEVGARHDGGDAETGFGVELGGGLAWVAPGLGLSLDLSGRTLVAHDDHTLKDRGFAASLGFDPDPATGRGPSFSLRQDWGGQAQGGLDALFTPAPLQDRAGGEAESRWTMEAAYGLPILGGRFTGSPHAGLGLSTGARDYTLGWRVEPEGGNTPDVSFGLEATRRESDAGTAEHSIGLAFEARW